MYKATNFYNIINEIFNDTICISVREQKYYTKTKKEKNYNSNRSYFFDLSHFLGDDCDFDILFLEFASLFSIFALND